MPLSDSLTTPIATPRRDSIVIIPMYNERENAAAIINAVLGLDGDLFDILVIEDNSPDGTAEIVKERMQSNPGRVHIIERKGKLGLGTAYIEGFKWALANGYKYICEMDADFSHNPLDLLKLREAVADPSCPGRPARSCRSPCSQAERPGSCI